MKKIRLYVFGYRDQSFWFEYGPIVRDLMMVSALSELDVIDEVIFYNRPVSFLEIVTGRKKLSYPHIRSDKIKFVSSFSWDLLGPLSRRGWFKNLYKKKYDVSPVLSSDYTNVVLDFLPIGDMPKWAEDADLYWYDLIDNFKKHNRYTRAERELVERKYDSV